MVDEDFDSGRSLSSAGVSMTETNNGVIGTCKLIGATNVTEIGETIENVYGQNPTGFLTYTSDGRMMAIITNGGRQPFATTSPSVQERAEAFSTMAAYAGRYTVSGERVIHHVQAAWVQN